MKNRAAVTNRTASRRSNVGQAHQLTSNYRSATASDTVPEGTWSLTSAEELIPGDSPRSDVHVRDWDAEQSSKRYGVSAGRSIEFHLNSALPPGN